jgi:hypothetical protein
MAVARDEVRESFGIVPACEARGRGLLGNRLLAFHLKANPITTLGTGGCHVSILQSLAEECERFQLLHEIASLVRSIGVAEVAGRGSTHGSCITPIPCARRS